MTWRDIKLIVTCADALLDIKSKEELNAMGEVAYYTAVLEVYEQLKDALI